MPLRASSVKKINMPERFRCEAMTEQFCSVSKLTTGCILCAYSNHWPPPAQLPVLPQSQRRPRSHPLRLHLHIITTASSIVFIGQSLQDYPRSVQSPSQTHYRQDREQAPLSPHSRQAQLQAALRVRHVRLRWTTYLRTRKQCPHRCPGTTAEREAFSILQI